MTIVALLLQAALKVRQAQGAESSLADALSGVDSWRDEWSACLAPYALASEIGVPEAQFRAYYPGIDWQKLPPRVLAALQAGSKALPDWSACLDDQTPTNVVEDDPVHIERARSRRLTRRELAGVVIALLVPGEVIGEATKEGKIDVPKVRASAIAWGESLDSAEPARRLNAWHARASIAERNRLTACAITWNYAPAYPLIEADFLARAAAPDDFFRLAVSAYVRHRRANAADFVKRLEAKLVPGDDEESAAFYRDMWRRLTEYHTMASAITAWTRGNLNDDGLVYLVARSIDQPWVYHSAALEPIAVHRRVAEANLRDIVGAAVRESEIDRRMRLSAAAVYTAGLLRAIIRRSERWERSPLPRIDAPEWRETIKGLRTLLDDDRLTAGGDAPSSPADLAAKTILDLWGDRTYANELWRRQDSDWRIEALREKTNGYRLLRVAGAKAVLGLTNSFRPEPFPDARAARLAATLPEESNASRRERLAALDWESRLMLQLYAGRNGEFALRCLPRLLEFQEVQGAEGRQPPASFLAIWRDRIGRLPLDDKAWKTICAWLAEEALVGRYWGIYLESSVSRPGIDVVVVPGQRKEGTDQDPPVLISRISGNPSPLGRDYFEIRRTGLVRVDRTGQRVDEQDSEVLRIVTGKSEDLFRRIEDGFVIFLATAP